MSAPVRSDSVDIGECIEDILPPVGCFLSGRYKRSFAYQTIKDRLPVILTKIIDGLSRNKEWIADKYGLEAVHEIKHIVGSISKLKNEMVTNKPITPIPDAVKWNEKLKQLEESRGEVQTWYNTVWLFCECYMYRRIGQELEISKHLKFYDPFEEQKQDGFNESIQSMYHLSKHILRLFSFNIKDEELKGHFISLLKSSLWGNRCDLSLSMGAVTSQTENQLDSIKTMDGLILTDNSNGVWDVITKKCFLGKNNCIDIVLDNVGYELFTDLCLAALLSHHRSTRVRFYVKKYPWFVSDVMSKDFSWTLEAMKMSENEDLKKFGGICQNFLNSNLWSIEEESFWTEPYDFSEMFTTDPTLYKKLSEAGLVIFKGDLNYRKLLGDLNCEYTTDFGTALRGFHPTNLVALRTIKADLCAALPVGKSEILDREDPGWTNKGKYGLIQLFVKD